MEPEPIDSVLLIGFGGPTRPDEVVPFLRNVVEGRDVPRERLEEVARHYAALGGRSPYNEQTFTQASLLAVHLRERGAEIPVHVGMRNWEPLLWRTIARMGAAGLRSAAGVILAAHRSPASWDRYQQDVALGLATAASLGPVPRVTYVEPWFADPGFLRACAAQITAVTGIRAGAWPTGLPLIFTAHSIPMEMSRRCPYVEDVLTSCRGVAAILEAREWRLAYQSRSGDPSSAWLEPDICVVLRELAAAGHRRVVVQAIGFLTDHVEVLHDLDVQAGALAKALGVEMLRAPCAGCHPELIAMLGHRILRLAGRAA